MWKNEPKQQKAKYEVYFRFNKHIDYKYITSAKSLVLANATLGSLCAIYKLPENEEYGYVKVLFPAWKDVFPDGEPTDKELLPDTHPLMDKQEEIKF